MTVEQIIQESVKESKLQIEKARRMKSESFLIIIQVQRPINI